MQYIAAITNPSQRAEVERWVSNSYWLCSTSSHTVRPRLVYWHWKVLLSLCENWQSDQRFPLLTLFVVFIIILLLFFLCLSFTLLHLLSFPPSSLMPPPPLLWPPAVQCEYRDCWLCYSLSIHFIVLLQLLLMKSKSTARYRVGVEP